MSGTSQEPAAEPSMDEILSSIRRILKDDDAVSIPADEDKTASGKPVLDLDPSMIVAGGDGPTAKSGEELREAGGVASEPALSSTLPPGTRTDTRLETGEVSIRSPEQLIGAAAATATASHIDSLRQTILSERTAALGRGDLTIEEIVRAELRPLLKVWLDQNLPGVVERIVRNEIERLIGRDRP